LEDEIDISRGDMIVKGNNPPQKDQNIEAMVCWFSNSKKLTPRSKFHLRHTTHEVKAVIQEIRYKVNINTLHKEEDQSEMALNEIGRVSIRTSGPLFFDSYRSNRTTGSFVLIDSQTNETVGAGMIV
jgi:sulfate adenylyltransferase subunit 1